MDLRDGILTGISQSEPTITERNLLTLHREHQGQTFVRKFNNWEEGNRTGADWEWWIGAAQSWLCLRVQAKKIDSGSMTYPELPHTSRRGRQVDMLLADAANNGFVPIYCFYNFWPSSSYPSPTWNCGSFEREARLLGCAIADGYAIRDLVNQGNFGIKDVIPLSFPWSCLSCCHGWVNYGAKPEEQARSLIANLPGRGDQGIAELISQPPDYVREVILGRSVRERPEVPYVVVTQSRLEESEQ